MKFKRQDLLDVVEDLIKKQEQRVEEYETAKSTYAAKKLDSWLENDATYWSLLAKHITDSLKKKTPITEKSVKVALRQTSARYSPELSYYSESNPSYFTLGDKKYEKIVVDPRLRELKLLLSISEDEIITSSALRDLGYRNLEWLFKLVAAK